ncbi:MAG: hypothetical protein IJD48_00340, partial [Clostridia bacterium]|nr:hypothetical protein [Clostridia bacterium]
NPQPYITSTFNGFKVWATIVLPSLFVFLILTKLLMQNDKTMRVFYILNRPFEKIYNCKYGGYIFAMSVISGYPVGASLITEFYNQNLIDNKSAKILCSFCSTSGPMFIMGCIATSMIFNTKIGLIILICHLSSSLINGLIYKWFLDKKYPVKKTINTYKNGNTTAIQHLNKKQSFNEIMLNAAISTLMVGGSIAFCFALVELVFVVLNPILNTINLSNFVLVMKGIIGGIFEVTNGCLQISSLTLNPILLTTVLCGLISFGGLSIHLQSIVFLSKAKISYKYFLLTKITQTIISVVLSMIFALILL